MATTSASELKLIQGVELKIALASTDKSLEKVLGTYLCPLLLKLSTPFADNRRKVEEVLDLIDRRILDKKHVRLPLQNLLTQYKSSDVHQNVRDRALMYLNRALPELHCDASTFSLLVSGFANYPHHQQSFTFHILCRMLANFRKPDSPAEEQRMTDDFRIHDKQDEQSFARALLDMVLLDGKQISLRARAASSSSELTLSPSQAAFLIPEGTTMSVSALNAIKIGILRYVALPVINVAFRAVISLVASFDLNHDTQLQAGITLRRCDFHQEEVLYVETLYDLCINQGYLEPKLHIRILQLLAKSEIASQKTELAQRCISRGLKSSKPKVRSASIVLLSWIARMSRPEQTNFQTKTILSQLTSYLESAEESDDARSSAYVAMGLVCRRDRHFTRAHPEVIKSLFLALASEIHAVRTAVNEALSGLVHEFIDAPLESLLELQRILSDVVRNGPPHSHYTALRISNATYDFADVQARWLCILAVQAAGPVEALQEATRGLDLHLFLLSRQDIRGAKYPSFQSFINGCTIDFDISSVEELNERARAAWLMFSRTCLFGEILHAQETFDAQQENFARKLDDTIRHDSKARNLIRATLSDDQNAEFNRALALFEVQALDIYLQEPSIIAGENLLDSLLLMGDSMSARVYEKFERFKGIKAFKTKYLAELHSRLYAIIITAPSHDTSSLCHLVDELVASLTISADIGQAAQALNLLANILLRAELRGRALQIDQQAIEQFITHALGQKDRSVLREHVEAVHILGLTSTLSSMVRKALCQALTNLVQKHSSDASSSEKIYLALGTLSTGLSSESEELSTIVENLVQEPVVQSRVEYILAKGEALACCLGRWDSKTLQDQSDVPINIQLHRVRSDLCTEVILRLVVQTRSPKPQERRGACIKLVSMIQLLNIAEVNEKLVSIHTSFLGLLADHDEYVVESANKGIQIVYARCDKNVKDELLAQLFSTMTSDTAAKQTSAPISAETEVFRSGSVTVGSGPDESSVSTYKDICNLAMEAGNSSLVYSFLNLASSSAMWSTRRGVALGLSSLLSSEGNERIISTSPELLKRLLPKLFRYKHDPSSKVAKAMNSIFQQLFPDAKNSIDQHFGVVYAELCKGLSDQAWRVRESSARAMITLLSGRSLASLRIDIDHVWALAFRVLDDVKESVRSAGIDLCQSLSNQVMKAIIGNTSSEKAHSTLDGILPLLVKHLKSTSAEISAFALKTLLRITKDSGSSIRDFLPSLIDEYLQLTSTMEPEMMNYLSFHASKYNITQSDLDNHRLASMRSSPLMDALEQCIDKLDAQSMQETVPRLCQVIRQTSGLPTKAATSRFLISLTVRCPTLVQPYADNILQALSSGLKDRSPAVVSAYASCTGYLARVANSEKIEKLVSFLAKSFFSAEDTSGALASVIKSISQSANDKFNNMASLFYPLCFLAMHDPDEKSANLFKGIWQDNTGSVQALKLYLPEVLPLLEQHLSNPAWKIKQMAASTIADIAERLELGKYMQPVLIAVISALKGKSWNGKETVLQALVALLQRHMKELSVEQIDEIRTLMFREARRSNLEYKRHSLLHLTTFVNLDRKTNMFADVLETVDDLLSPTAMDHDLDELSQPMKLVLVQNALHCLISAFNPSHGTTEEYRTMLTYVTHQAEIRPWNVKSQISQDLETLFTRVAAEDSVQALWTSQEVERTWRFLVTLASDSSYQSLREEASKSIEAFLSACTAQQVSAAQMHSMKGDVERMIRDEPSTIIQAMLKALPF